MVTDGPDDRSKLHTRLSRRVLLRSAAGCAVLPLIGCGDDADGDVTTHGGGARDAAGDADTPDAGRPPDAGDTGDASDAAAPTLPDGGMLPELCTPFITPDDEFPPLYGGNGTVEGWVRPSIDGDRWRLSIEGLVRNPLQISLDELEADAAQVHVVNTLQCVFGSRGTAIWTGVPLSALLERAGLQRDSTRRLRFFGADGFQNNLRIEDVLEPEPEVFEPLIAFRMNGAPLSEKLGYPARLLLTDRYGFKNTKWLIAVEATASDEEFGQYQGEPFNLASDAGTLEPNGRIDTPRRIAAGPTLLCGHGLSGHGGVERVQLSIGGQPFEDARLLSLDEVLATTPALAGTLQAQSPERFPWPYRGVWAPWELEHDFPPGEHTVSFRILDRGGRVADGFNMLIEAE